nr:OTU domain-containing protein 7B-like isoform X2 [Procambarus clarkii]
MEAEKVTEFISYTQADPVLARQILQSENWDVKAAVRLFSVLRGASPFHHSGPVRSSPPNFSSSVKPPVAPKPIYEHKPTYDTRHLAEGRSSSGSKLAPLPPPRVRKVGALPKLYHEGQSGVPMLTHVLPSVGPDVLPVANILVEPYSKSINTTRVNSLPPLQKCCGSVNRSVNFCQGPDFSSCTTPVATSSVPSINKYPSKPQSGSAKNALLKEKVRGTSASFLESQRNSVHDGTSRSSSVPHSSTIPSQITVNSSCIISVNNPNNNTNKNNNIYLNDFSPSVNDSGTLSTASQTTNSVYNASSHSSPLSYSMQAASKDSPYSSSAVPFVTGPSSVIISSITSSIDTNTRDSKLVRIINVDSSKDYLCPPGFKDRSDREANCVCDCQESRLPEKNTNHKDLPLTENVTNKIIDGERFSSDETDCVLRPEVSNLVSSGSGPSLSAPCSPAKPLLRKTEAVDLEEYDYYKKLSRGISKATDNVNIVSKARSEFAQEIWEAIDSSRTPFFIETPIFTFTLPDLSIYSDEFRLFLERDLIETSTLVSLEGAGRLNWWALIGASQRLWPLATTGDGNCLLHAASLGMWGFHDRLLTLRKALHEFLTRSQFSRPLWRRWRWQVAQQNRETGLVYSNEEWETEWANVLRLASSAPRGSQDSGGEGSSDSSQKTKGQTNTCSKADSPPACKRLSNGFQTSQSEDCTGHVYESLEEIHVLALAHVLRRPIIVVADITLKDVSGEPLAPIPFGGVYLPLECPPRECQRSPLLLTYDAAHFSALVVMETQAECSASQLPAVVPLTDCCHELLPIQFVIDPGEDFVWGQDDQNPIIVQKLTITNHDQVGLLNEYLDVTQVPIPPGYLEACQAVDEADSPENYHPEIEKKSSESSFDSDEGPPFIDGASGIFASKSKASKQLQTVAKQFGSIGKTMSKKIKKNFGTLSKLGRTGSFKKKDEYIKTCSVTKNGRMLKVSTHQNYILAAMIHTEKRHAYQEEMVRNYLNTARRRFEKDAELKKRQEEEIKQLKLEQLEHQSEMEGPVQCINPGCNMYGTALTSYMCSSCFSKQKEQEQKYKRQTTGNLNSPKSTHFRADGPQYGAGKSKFYAELDAASASDASKIPVIQPLSSKKDGTLYLSNSTFYSDSSTVPSYNIAKSQSAGPTNVSSVCTNTHSVEPDLPLQLSPATVITTTMGCQSSETFTPVAIDDVNVSVRGEDRSDSPSQPCLTRDCKFYGSCSTGGYCSRCYQENNSKGHKNVMVQQIKSVQL